jgi:uncharacterized repeat protein (TIGR01451 family)/uncharacterized delta-60 repeat protein
VGILFSNIDSEVFMQRSLAGFLGNVLTRAGLIRWGTLVLLSFAALSSWAAQPPNDSFAGAIVLTGSQSLAPLGDNSSGATKEPGEPEHVGNAGGASLWYSWTAPFSGQVTFNTEASSFDTILAAYIANDPNAPDVADLLSVASNDDVNFPADLTSRITFEVTSGTTYYIAVDGYGGASGPIKLNWRPIGANAAGTFSFASPYSGPLDGVPLYVIGDLESQQDFISSMPKYTQPQLTVTRTGGSSGRVRVYFTVTNSVYTNLVELNVFGSNYFNTNIDATTGAMLSYSNVYQTNFVPFQAAQHFSFNFGFNASCITTNTFGTYTNIVVIGGPGGSSSNFSGGPIISTNAVYPTFPLDPVTVTTPTNISIATRFSFSTQTNQIVPSANPLGGTNFPSDYIPYSSYLDFWDYQMSATITLTNLPSSFFFSGNPFDPFSFTPRNPLIAVTLDSVQFDPLESTNLVPPTIDPVKGVARVSVLNQISFAGNPCATTNIIINLERAHFRIPESQGVAHIGIYPSFQDGTAGATINYLVDELPVYHFHQNQNNRFNNEPASDYATPGGQPIFPDPAPGSSQPADFTPVTGSITWGPTENVIKFIDIPITQDDLVEFNEDFMVAIWVPPTTAVLGQLTTAIVTILFDDQPAGAVDRDHNPSGSANTDPPFNEFPGANDAVHALAVQPDGKTVFAGDFTGYNTQDRFQHIGRMNANGSADLTFMASTTAGANEPINCLALAPDGTINIGGDFTSYDGTNRYRIARLTADGRLDATFNTGLGANGPVKAMALQPDGQLLVSGNFTYVNGTNRNYIVRLNPDGTVDPTFNPGLGPNAPVQAVAVQSDGRIVIGGEFVTVGGVPRHSIARLNGDGSLDLSFDPQQGADQPVYAVTLQPDGRVLIGGAFTIFNNDNHNHLTRLNADGSLDLTFEPGSGPDDTVNTIVMQPDGNILIGGFFTSVNSTRRVGIARLLANGWVDTSFMDTAYNQFAGLVSKYADRDVEPKSGLYSMGLQPDGKVMIGGHFEQVGGGAARDSHEPRRNIARLIGGATPGPGNIGLANHSYNADENGGKRFITLERSNGFLGPASVTFRPVATGTGPGAAIDNVNYSQGGTPTPIWGNVDWPTATWMYSDAITGPNNATGNKGDDVYINIVNNGTLDGSRTLDVQVSQPSSADSFFLGGNGSFNPDYFTQPGYGVNIPLGVALGLTHAPLTIIDDESAHGVIGFTSPTFKVSENGTNATITVNRTNGASGSVTVSYFTSNGTNNPPFTSGGIAGTTNDYLGVNGQLRFDSGETSKTFTIPIVNNSAVQLDRTVNLRLSNVTGGGAAGLTNSVLTIIDDDFLPGHLNFSITNFTAHESDGTATLTVARSGGNAGAISIGFATTNGTAISGVNYTGKPGNTNVLTWNDGDNSTKSFTIPVFQDGLVTSDLTLSLGIFNPRINGVSTPALLGPVKSATLTIINDDHFGSPAFSTAFYTVNENSVAAHITVIRQGGSAQSITVPYNTLDVGSALAGTDYIGTNGTLTFGPGEFSKSFDVAINDDGQQNGNRFLTLQLGAPSPAAASNGSPSSAFLTIIDDETSHEPSGGVDTTYNPNAFFNGNVYALVQQPTDGKILAGGDFTVANSFVRNRIARLNADGTLDVKFSSATAGANGSIRALVSQTDGRILVGGLFTTFNNVGNHYFARLNLDGSLDTSFNLGSAADNPVYGIAETFVGSGTNAVRKILLGGSFVTINGTARSCIARLNDNGTLDTSFDPGLGANGTVYAVAVYGVNDANAGKVLIAGDFTLVNGSVRNHIARLNADGSLDTSFNPGAGPNNSIRALAIQVDGSVVIGGLFTALNGAEMNRIGRLLSNGAVDPNFTPGSGANDVVSCIVLQEDQKIVLGGGFTQANGVTRNRITRLNLDGTVDPAINFGLGANDFVAAMIVQKDSKMLIGGGFTTYDGLSKPHIARIYGRITAGQGAFEFSAPNYQVSENGTNVLITVRRTGGTGDTSFGDVSVTFQTSDNTAIAGVDYEGVSTNLIFPVGETIATVTLWVTNNFLVESNKLVDLALVNPVGGDLGAQGSAQLTILNDDSAVSFNSTDYRVAKNVGNGAAIITVVRSGSSIGPAAVDFVTTTNGTAVAGVDYLLVTNTVTFVDGETTKTVAVPIINNALLEGGLTVDMTLSNPSNTVLLSPTEATLTILDNSLAPGNIMFVPTGYFAGEAATNAVITLIRTNGSVGQASVTVSASGGTATPGFDYAPTNGTVVFADGETSKNFLVRVFRNTQVTGNLTVDITLSNPTGGVGLVGPPTVPLTILDQDIGVNFSPGFYFANEDAGSVTLTVQRVGGTNGTFFVQYATTNGTALAGTNYLATSGTLNFGVGEVLKTLTVPILHNPQVQGNVIFLVNLVSSPGSGQLAAPSTATVTVIDTDRGFVFASPTNSVSEAGTNVIIGVLRLGSTSGSNSINFAASNGTATNGLRYIATNGVMTFVDGQASNSFTVSIINNTIVDGDQTVNLTLSNPSAGAQLLSPSNSVLTIVDDDSSFSFSSPNYVVDEGAHILTITVQRLGILTNTVSVNFATGDGAGIGDLKAVAPNDYTATNGTLIFTNGVTSQTFDVVIIDDTIIEGNESFHVTLSNPLNSAQAQATVTILDNDGGQIVASGSALVSESLAPANGYIDPGETVTLLLGLRDAAGMNTTNLVATLLATNGVSAPSGPQTYGVLITNGPSASRPFTFTANGTNGGQVTLLLHLQDGTKDLGTASFGFALGKFTTGFTNSGVIVIKDNPAVAAPYPASISVTNVAGLINKITVTVSNLSHPSLSDVQMLLVSPTGQKELLMVGAGFHLPVSHVTLTFDDAAANSLSSGSAPSSGTYKPSVLVTPATFPIPAPAGPYGSVLSGFNGTSPNGDWSLYVFDNTSLDAGGITNGWSLAITTTSPVAPSPDLALGVTELPNPPIVTSNFTYTISVTNFGPSAATGVKVTDVLPAGITFVSATAPGGTSTNGSGQVTLNLGALATNATATASMTVNAGFIGTITNTFTVSENEIDPFLTNNVVPLVTTISGTTSDLSIGLVGSPNPVVMGANVTFTISATNLGPATATSVIVTNILPSGFSFVSASSGYSNAGGMVTWNVGNLVSGARTNLSLVVKTTAGGTITNDVSIGSTVNDPLKGNNKASAKIVVDTVQLASSRAGSNLIFTWPQGYVLESTPTLNPANWIQVTVPAPQFIGGQYTVTVSTTTGTQYFRLRGTAAP